MEDFMKCSTTMGAHHNQSVNPPAMTAQQGPSGIINNRSNGHECSHIGYTAIISNNTDIQPKTWLYT